MNGEPTPLGQAGRALSHHRIAERASTYLVTYNERHLLCSCYVDVLYAMSYLHVHCSGEQKYRDEQKILSSIFRLRGNSDMFSNSHTCRKMLFT